MLRHSFKVMRGLEREREMHQCSTIEYLLYPVSKMSLWSLNLRGKRESKVLEDSRVTRKYQESWRFPVKLCYIAWCYCSFKWLRKRIKILIEFLGYDIDTCSLLSWRFRLEVTMGVGSLMHVRVSRLATAEELLILVPYRYAMFKGRRKEVPNSTALFEIDICSVGVVIFWCMVIFQGSSVCYMEESVEEQLDSVWGLSSSHVEVSSTMVVSGLLQLLVDASHRLEELFS